MPHTLSTIPPELLTEILSYLGIPSLKFLRRAIPCRRILTFTAQILFREFTIRLATPAGSAMRLGEFLNYKPPLSEPTETDSGYGGIFANMRRFVLDTRYPIISNNGRGLEAIMLGRDFLRQDLPKLASYVERQQLEGLENLIEVVEKIIATGCRLTEISWLTSGSLYPYVHASLSSMLCSPVTERQYQLHVLLITNSVSNLMHYCPQLSNLHRFTIRFIENLDTTNIYNCLDPEHVQCLAQTILRSKDSLQHFMLDLRGVQTSPRANRPLFAALEQATELRSLETYALGGFTLDLDFTNLKKLVYIASAQTRVWQLAEGKYTETNDPWDPDDEASYQYKLFQQILNSDVRLERVCVMNYGKAIHNFFLRNESCITHIDLFGISEANKELAPLFWEQVVPKYAATLKKIGARFANDDGAWIWKDDPQNLVKAALSQCKNLEVLKICFYCGASAPGQPTRVGRNENHILPMIDSLSTTCSKISTIYIDFCGPAAELQAEDSRWQILKWTGRPKEGILEERYLDIIFEVRAGPCARTTVPTLSKISQLRKRLLGSYPKKPDYLAGYTGMPLLYDAHIISWQLPISECKKPGRYMAYSDEVYRYDDGSEKEWGAYEEFLQYG
ncbi:hypothetical protein TWF191_002434 [Orbilia oligospora]|uniref:F-box domain-containing protein n=1 Tax=Orbilia oligospora TaxID=2813651 RepID=A0A7C8V2M6_ORBOL|nr:hypothetical protein TWF191_002434 [Orbilia oligospora]